MGWDKQCSGGPGEGNKISLCASSSHLNIFFCNLLPSGKKRCVHALEILQDDIQRLLCVAKKAARCLQSLEWKHKNMFMKKKEKIAVMTIVK